ncbi:MAG: DUF5320 domain-containing protein [Armatimonadetes bacterium]|nr:DUF5320 domain-containing protein [Armatimonadota bacterium]
MRHRNMFYATGLPGWMRFGYSPGWVGRSPSGLGPCAQFLLTGQWPTPQMQQAWQGAQPAGIDRLTLLKNQAAMLEQQLNAIKSQISELEKD